MPWAAAGTSRSRISDAAAVVFVVVVFRVAFLLTATIDKFSELYGRLLDEKQMCVWLLSLVALGAAGDASEHRSPIDHSMQL